MMMMMMMMMMKMAQKAQSEIFTIPSLLCELSPTRLLKQSGRSRVPIMRNTSSAYHVQHIMYHVA